MADETDRDQPGQGRLAHAPADHPAQPRARVGVILSNLGTPDGTDYWSMRRYLSEFLSDSRVIDYPRWKWQPILQGIILTKRPFSSGRAYASIWNTERDESPLLTTTREQTEAVRAGLAALFGDSVMVDFCMRYGNPSTESVIRRMQAAGCERIVFFPLYPQYAGATTATANDQAFRALMKLKWQPSIRTVPAYYDHPLYIDALARSVEAVYAGMERRPEHLITSYHGVPKRYLMEGDPYHCQCRKTSRLLRDRLGMSDDELKVTFQSKFGPEEWLQPYTVEEVARMARAGTRRIAIMAPAFSSDCVETLEEINEEIRESFLHAGGEEFTYIPCLNAGDAHVAMLIDILCRELQGWAVPAAG
ncbi:ferrochelatase [Paroceanicella profunda]|uniref:Ferrochelatase n=1 Tax=Paroceanicella profunda TaxID=2579971 RepID=A0A5B8FUH5_9RHOB|nr:ferrochelatase [Paroceanicella profunda]QDL92035.1 ferrochelatase [Paroceanicella profunda]